MKNGILKTTVYRFFERRMCCLTSWILPLAEISRCGGIYRLWHLALSWAWEGRPEGKL